MLDVWSMHPHDKLFIPVQLKFPKNLGGVFASVDGHRSEDFKNLYREIHPKLQTLFGTKQPVFLSTSSAWGVMEASIRNLVDRGVLCCMCGAFFGQMVRCREAMREKREPLQVEWGKHIDQKDLDRQLATGKFDTVTLTHSETSPRDESAPRNLLHPGQISRFVLIVIPYRHSLV